MTDLEKNSEVKGAYSVAREHGWVVRDGVTYKVGAHTGEKGELVYLLREPPVGDHLRDLIVVPVAEVQIRPESRSVFGRLPGIPDSAVEPGDFL